MTDHTGVMKSRKLVLGGVLAFIGLPAVLALTGAVSFYLSNRSNGTLVSSGQQREYLLYVPRSYDRARPTPLVISLHGAGGWPVQQMKLSRWNRLADAQGFIVVYPAGARGVGPRVWHVDPELGPTKDVRFISELIDTLEASYNIDPARIYANGISNGGGMSFVLSCTLSHRIAAVGMVAAAQTLRWSWCTDRRPVPMIAFHGTADPLTPYHGGTSWIVSEALPDMLTWTKLWARRNQCGASAVDSVVAPDVTRLEYPACADGATVELYTIAGGGHSWPGGEPMMEWWVGPTSNSIDATRQMWAFFRAHPRPTK
jgi:polyhydroxybutyrate depolymerase